MYLENGRQRFDYSGSVKRLLGLPYDRAMIDIPIGLPPAFSSNKWKLIGPARQLAHRGIEAG